MKCAKITQQSDLALEKEKFEKNVTDNDLSEKTLLSSFLYGDADDEISIIINQQLSTAIMAIKTC